MGGLRTNLWILIAAVIFLGFASLAIAQSLRIRGEVLDPFSEQVGGATVEFDSASGEKLLTTTDADGSFRVALPHRGIYTVLIRAQGFVTVAQQLDLDLMAADLQLHLGEIASAPTQVVVSAHVGDVTMDSPDPSQRVMVREELLDANPGRPGAPVSIPGYPIETASGGIKAPQYFVPGVAGDHGEPIAQYIAVGGYLVPNNLSANAHGNGYADPNIYVSAALGSVATDGGAFNVLEGNHALNLAAVYSPRLQLKRFLTVTGDYRDLDLTAGFGSSDPTRKEWLALEVSYGNGLLKRLEHRQQYKWNAMRIYDPGQHEITLFSAGYYGSSREGNLVPIGLGSVLNDTLDPRQRDQTHTALLAADDRWHVGVSDELSFSAHLRTYNLSLFSNFGEGLIRQSEFRTVEGAQARETHTFAEWLQVMAGFDYNEDDIHNDNLDHYLADDPQVFGPFVKVLANNLKIRDAAPYVALRGDIGLHLHYYAGLRDDRVELRNEDLLDPGESSDLWNGFISPKVTLAWTPGNGPVRWLPSASFSIGQAFFSQDPRISLAAKATSGLSPTTSPFERSHSEQLVMEKTFSSTDVRVTLGRTTTTSTLAKIDPDDGLAEDEGPGTLKFLTASVRRQFSFGSIQGVFSKADARDDRTGIVTPEAPRTIFDALTTLDHLPGGLHARAEYEYVGHKLLDVGNSAHPEPYEAIPVGETRLAVVRSFMKDRLELGINGMIARGYTGQTTETFDPDWRVSELPYCSGGMNGIANNFDCGTVERAVGIRMVSWVGGSVSWRFGSNK